MLKEGERAPDFELKNTQGQSISLKSLKGQKVILYFYPKDDTPGCTIQAVGFSEKLTEFKDKNTLVFGVSKDSEESHQQFCTKYNLTVNLLSDPEMEVINKYYVWREKNNYGKKIMGIVRSTFLIDEMGNIKKIWRHFKVDGHVDKVLSSIN